MNINDTSGIVLAVRDISGQILQEVGTAPYRQEGERALWFELSCCILSSQVPYELAFSAARRLDDSGILLDTRAKEETLVATMLDLLSLPLRLGTSQRRYRFPMARAHQLATVRLRVSDRYGSLLNLLHHPSSPVELRARLIQDLPGVGPKQASMFLRNAGVTYDLAVLDRHVLRYMSMAGLAADDVLKSAPLRSYEIAEDCLRAHARWLRVPVGILDWAIWIVMRAARHVRTRSRLCWTAVH